MVVHTCNLSARRQEDCFESEASLGEVHSESWVSLDQSQTLSRQSKAEESKEPQSQS